MAENRFKRLTLGGRIVGKCNRPYIIAEIGVNHEGSLELAKNLIELAREGGADAAKFQSYKASALASRDSPAYWDTSKEPTPSQHDLFKKYDTFGPKEYYDLALHCKSVGIDFLSTPFDFEAIDFLEPLVPFYKIASADITNIPFLRRIASKSKPVILSTGASTMAEIDSALATLREDGCYEIALLHCVLNYPTENKNAHLHMIRGLQHAYPELLVGYSDHTLPDYNMLSLLTAAILGSVIIEKHFTHDKSLKGNDHYHAMDVHDLKRFTELLDNVLLILGDTEYKAPVATEAISRLNARRSIVLAKRAPAGTMLQESMLTTKRPGTGISPRCWDDVIGMVALEDLEEDQILSWSHLVRKPEEK